MKNRPNSGHDQTAAESTSRSVWLLVPYTPDVSMKLRVFHRRKNRQGFDHDQMALKSQQVGH